MNTHPGPANFIRREYALSLVILAILAVLAALGNQLVQHVESLRTAPQDNAQWNLAQLDVDLLALNSAILDATDGSDASLVDVRRRFDVFYSRVNTVRRMSLFANKLVNQESLDNMAQIRTTLEGLVPTIDGTDPDLRQQLPRLSRSMEVMRPMAREIGLDGVRIYAAQSDAKREEFIRLLWRTATVNGLLLIGLGTMLLFLVRQVRISRRRASELDVVNDRNASTVNSALDAIIAVDTNGVIVEFNPAATRIFGYSRNAAIGAKLDELIVPARSRDVYHKELVRYRSAGQKSTVDAGRVEMLALRADGSEFPVEFSLGVTQASEGQLIIAFLRDISQRVEQEKELRAARDGAVEAAKAKSQFLAIMSHEMRTPLNGVMAVLDLLGATNLDSKQKTYVRTATTSAEILKQHVDDVLDLTRMQAGKLEFFPRAFNLVELLEEVENINLATAATRGNRIALSIDMPQPYFVADRKRVHQVLTNLVGNAIKFTENGRIGIAAKLKQVEAEVMMVEFTVSDTGVGIPKDEQARIFEDFVTLDASYQRRAAGAGLGLPICKSIVEAMGGVIGVESSPGTGSHFWFRLPLKAAFAQEVLGEKPGRKKTDPAASRRLRVLVVEDNETNRFVAGEMLQASQCDVVLAPDGKEGAALATDQAFDVIFMDLSMPNMNGWDAARLIRSRGQAKSQKSPIYALTAHALPEEQKAIREAGMEGCILKPLRAHALENILESVRALQEGAATPMPHPRADGIADQAVLAELQEVLGSQIFNVRLGVFLGELGDVTAQINAMAKAGTWEELAKLAHKFAGSAALFGARQLADDLRRLESAAKSKSAADITSQIAKVDGSVPVTAEVFARCALP